MKQLVQLSLLVLFVWGATAHAAVDRSWVDRCFDKHWVLAPHPDQVLVLYRAGATDADRLSAARSEELALQHEFNPAYRTAVYRIAAEENAEAVADRLSLHDAVEAAVPAVVDGEGYTKYYIPRQLTVQFNKDLSDEVCRAAIRAAGSEVLRDYWTPGYYKITTPVEQDVFAAIRSWYQHDDVLFAEPIYMCYNDAVHVPNDPYFPEQWALRNTGQQGWTPGADVQAVDAWDLTLGSPNVVVTIIDTGMDLDHEDLEANLLPRGDDDWDFADADPIPEDEGNHGTCCCGIAAAVQDNNLGVSGVAPMCRLMPLRVNLSSGQNANRADAINYAASRRAEFDGLVMSNSWIMSSGDFTSVQLACENAHALDCVVCFASGNDNGDIRYPAKYPETIAVGASSPCDERKSPSSCDGETHWGSNYGPEQDIVAPGVKIYTTDRAGSSGYSSGDYFDEFNGTSSACPLAAGICALIYSANPALSNEEVREILRETAEDEVGPPGEDTPGWDPYMGWGRVNAYEAVLAAGTGFGQIAGTVTNASNGYTPIEGATVEAIEPERSTETDEFGTYVLNIAPGTYTMRASHPSFETVTAPDINIPEGETVTLNFQLNDIGGPEITGTTELRSTEDTVGPYTVESTVTDFTQLSSVRLYYRIHGGPWYVLNMLSAGGDLHAADIPGQMHNTYIEYYVRAEDLVHNASTVPPGAPDVLYDFWVAPIGEVLADDMETGAPDWTHEAVTSGFSDQWHLSTQRNHTSGGVTSWKCGDTGDGNYANLLDAALVTPAVDLALDSSLRYWQWIDAEESSVYPGYAYDGGLIELSAEGGEWTQITPIGGYTHLIRTGSTAGPFAADTPVFSGAVDWHEVELDLSGYEGSVQIRFRFGTDGADVREGWFIDDVMLDGFLIDLSAAELERAPLALHLAAADPNPFRNATVLRYQLPQATEVSLQVFDLGGRLVRTLVSGPQTPGRYALSWNGRDDGARPVPSGVYLTRLSAGNASTTGKVMITR